jgi:hypothetical protein
MLPVSRLKPSRRLQVLAEFHAGSAPAALLGPTQLPEHLMRTDICKVSFQEIFQGESLSDHDNLG